MARRVVFAFLTAVLLVTSAHLAGAAPIAPGDRAPDFVGKEFVNGEPCSLKSLRGQVVFLDIFRTWCGPCNEQAPHLTELHEKYGAKGLRVIGITNEPRSKVDAFVAKHSSKHMIVVETTESGDAFGTNTVPSPWLIGADGRVIAKGVPSEAQIEEALASVRLPPELPKALQPLAAPLKKERFGEVRTKVTTLLAGTTLVEGDRKAAEELGAWIDWRAGNALEDAKAEGEKGRWYEATLSLEAAVTCFKGMPASTDAATQLKAILADKARKDAVTAGKRLEAAIERMREKDLDPEEAIPLFKAIASKYEETVPGKRAAAIVAELEGKQKKKD
jgi:peroxiredoxin